MLGEKHPDTLIAISNVSFLLRAEEWNITLEAMAEPSDQPAPDPK